jgi:formate-dependent phosphoribosylglycinamide formyltransferase (GAR transformylase)
VALARDTDVEQAKNRAVAAASAIKIVYSNG